MNHVLHAIWSIPFMAGLAVGLIGYHCYAMGRCRWRNKHQPLPGGARYRHRISRLWSGALLAALILVYILAQMEQRATKADECYREFSDSIVGYAKISEENDRLSREHRTLLTQHNDATVDWINKLVYPPPDIARLPQSATARQEYGLSLTRTYFSHIQELTRNMNAIEDQQTNLEHYRAEHPLNKLKCGVVNG